MENILLEIHNAFNHIWYDDKSHQYYNKRTKDFLISSTTKKKEYIPEFNAAKMLPLSAKSKGVSVEELKKEWDYLKEYGQERGNLVHDFLQHAGERRFLYNDLNIVSKKDKDILIKQAREYVKDFSDYIHIRSELVVGNDFFAGMLDRLIMSNPHNTLVDERPQLILHDYKTDKEIYKKPYGNLLSPFEYLENTIINGYRIQLSIYKRLFEEATGIIIDKIVIIWFATTNKSYELIEIEPLNLDDIW